MSIAHSGDTQALDTLQVRENEGLRGAYISSAVDPREHYCRGFAVYDQDGRDVGGAIFQVTGPDGLWNRYGTWNAALGRYDLYGYTEKLTQAQDDIRHDVLLARQREAAEERQPLSHEASTFVLDGGGEHDRIFVFRRDDVRRDQMMERELRNEFIASYALFDPADRPTGYAVIQSAEPGTYRTVEWDAQKRGYVTIGDHGDLQQAQRALTMEFMAHGPRLSTRTIMEDFLAHGF